MSIKEAIKEIKSKNDLLTVLNYYGIQVNKDDKAVCPFHNEKTPSFSIKESNNEAMWHCFGSCGESGDIVSFIQKQNGISVLEATKKAYEILGKPLQLEGSNDKLGNFINFISNNKWEGWNYENTYIYKNSNNEPVYLKHKYRSTTDKSKKTFVTKSIVETEKSYKHGAKEHFEKLEKVVYNLPKVQEAINKGNNIYIVEGEKDADTLIRMGFAATTIYSKKWEEAYTKQLTGAKLVFIGDTGKAGKEFRQLVWDNLKDVIPCFRVVSLPGLEALGDNKDVTDWLESGKTKDDLLEAIKDSWDWKVSSKWKDVRVTENKKTGEVKITPLTTLDNFKLLLERTDTKVYMNEISKVLQVETSFFNNRTTDTLVTEIYSKCVKEQFNIPRTTVREYLEAVGKERAINPFKTWVEQLPAWDSTSRIDKYLENFVTVEGYDVELKKKLMTKWLLSFIGTLYDENYKAYGFLILKGEQGIGKGECFKRLVPIKEDWVFLGEQEYKGDRDNVQILTSHLIVEFSEFARSAKKVNELKGFVTAGKDALSLKYDKYITSSKRNNIYYASVNDAEFLLDDSNRRMWVVDLESINWKGINEFDYMQLWAEIKAMYLANPIVEGQPCYHLTPTEKEILEEANKDYRFKTELGTRLEGLLDFDNPTRIYLTSAESVHLLDLKVSGTVVTKELKKLGLITGERKRFKGKAQARYNETPLLRSWHGEVPLKYKERIVGKPQLEIVEQIQVSTTEEASKEVLALKEENKRLKEVNLKLITKYETIIEQLKQENKELKGINNWYETSFKN